MDDTVWAALLVWFYFQVYFMPYLNAKIAGSQFVRLTDTRSHFHSHDALPLLVVNAPFCQATITLQGAQLLTFQPTGDKPWLWLSPYAQFESGKSIRGGIPVCLPWFGVNRKNPEKPKHGFVRNHDWELVSLQESATAIELEFGFTYNSERPELFNTPFTATLEMTLSGSLDFSLHIHNRATETAEFSWAFHSYFAVADCEETTVSGLEGIHYLDNTRGLNAFLQDGDIPFLQEVDRVYNHTTVPQSINAQQRLSVTGENCPTCIVWNAGKNVAATLADIREDYRHYICVERGCAFGDSLVLPAGATSSSTMTINRIKP